MRTIVEECDRQIDFVQVLLDLSRIESGAFRVSLAENDPASILKECVEASYRAALMREITLELEIPSFDLPLIVLLPASEGGA